MLSRCANGFGAVALSALMAEWNSADAKSPLAPRTPHYEPHAKNVIFLYMDGGPSHVDTFDYKPLLKKFDGVDPHEALGKLERTQFNNIGKVMQSQWKFRQHGESGAWVSELFPHIAQQVDKLCFVKSVVSKFAEHTFANYFLHTGSGLQGRPSMGAWVEYGLGSENRNLPGFVVLNGGLIPPGGLDNFNSGYLPASFQGSVFNAGDRPVANITPTEFAAAHQKNKLALLRDLDNLTLQQTGANDELESAIANYETAFRMQAAVPELMDLSSESKQTQEMYGFNAARKQTRTYAQSCLLARRLVERGVRFIELTCPGGNGDRWDQHRNLKDGHSKNCLTVDQPIAALLADLEQRGLLETTLVLFAGEFGRTPFAQGKDGLDHNPFGFTVWMAGGGAKPGISYGNTDEWGYKAVENKVEMHDLHATMLHLLGLNHTRTTFRFSSRDMRLTDVHGHILTEIIT